MGGLANLEYQTAMHSVALQLHSLSDNLKLLVDWRQIYRIVIGPSESIDLLPLYAYIDIARFPGFFWNQL